MRVLLALALAATPFAAFAQQASLPPVSPEQAAIMRQMIGEANERIVLYGGEVLKLQAELAKLKADLAKAQEPKAEPAK